MAEKEHKKSKPRQKGVSEVIQVSPGHTLFFHIPAELADDPLFSTRPEKKAAEASAE